MLRSSFSILPEIEEALVRYTCKVLNYNVERDGGGDREKKGGEVYGKRENKEKKYPILHNISQSKKCREAGANKYRAPQYIAYRD